MFPKKQIWALGNRRSKNSADEHKSHQSKGP